MQNLLPDSEVTICKYKSLIISVYSSNYGGQILCRGTEEGRKIYKNLQMKLPSKKNIQTSAKTFFQFFVYSHSLTRIFADSCNCCEASEV